MERPWEKVDAPNIVYKYRDWNDSRNKTIITKRQVFLSPSSGFKDPFDCKYVIRVDLLEAQQIWDWYHQSSLRDNSELNPEQHLHFANYWFDHSPLNDKESIKSQQIADGKEFDERFGILSLTANPVKYAMWKAYSKCHTGFCVGFNKEILFQFFGGGGPVTYVKKLPIIYPPPITSEDKAHELLIFRKLWKWRFEEEYRTHRMGVRALTTEDRTITLPPQAYREIIFGARMKKELKEEIFEIASVNMPNVEFKQAVINRFCRTVRIGPSELNSQKFLG